jgi:hypothetical protein
MGLKTSEEVFEFKNLCQQLNLKSLESLTMSTSGLPYPYSLPVKFGFKEMEPPTVNNDTLLSNFMHLPKNTR